MWTTSNSRGERRTDTVRSPVAASAVAMLLAAAACGCQSGSRQPRVGPESPAPALAAGAVSAGDVDRERPPTPRPPDSVNVRSARIVPARDVAADLAPAHVVKAARDPLLVEVTLDAPALEDRAAAAEPTDSMLVIVLNGERLLETRLVPGRPPRLRAFLPDRTLLRETNDVMVAWLGQEHLTRDVKGLALPLAEIPK